MTPREDLLGRLNRLAMDMSRVEVALGEMAATPGVKDFVALRNMARQAGNATARIYEWARRVKEGGSS